MTLRTPLHNRREFIGRVVGTFASTGVASAATYRPALGMADVEKPSERIRIGIIGCGGQGKGNMRPHLANIMAVCDVDSKRLAEAAAMVQKKNGAAPAAYGDLRKLLDDKNVDAVIVSTPDHWHALATILACQAGKDVYCEKPLTLTIAEGRAMVKAARKHNRIVQTGSQQRSAVNFRRACELVRSGRFGKIHTVRVGIAGVNFVGPPVADSDPPPELDYDMWLGPAPKRPYNAKRVHYLFRFFWDYSGGQMTNWGAHHLDIAHWGLAMDDSGPTTIEGKARLHKDLWYEVPEWFEVTYQYPNGTKIICGMSQRGGTTFEGENGTLHVNRGKLESNRPEILKEAAREGDVRLYVSRDHQQNWLDCIRSRKPPICDVETGHRSATACHLGNIAIRTGRKITWDPKTETIVGDEEAAKMVSRAFRSPWSLAKHES